jgi:hypothetical protein
MNETDSGTRCDGLRLSAPKERLLDKGVPAVKKGKANSKSISPLAKGKQIQHRLAVRDHNNGGFAYSHVNAFLGEYLNVGYSNRLISHLDCLFPNVWVVFRANAHVTRIPAARIMNPAALDPRRSSKYIHQTCDNGLSPFAAFGIVQNQTGNRGCKLIRGDSGFPFEVSITRLVATADSNEGA